MCGIFAFVGSSVDAEFEASIKEASNKISYRGPDEFRFERVSDNILFGFHRLSIMDLSTGGSQPMRSPYNNNITLICNGEIYNYAELAEKYNFNMRSNSDCEVILHLYDKMPFDQILNELDGVFSFVLSDKDSGTVYAARDPFGVRPLFACNPDNGDKAFCSEAKGLVSISSDIFHFPPGSYWSSKSPDEFVSYYDRSVTLVDDSMDDILYNVREKLESAVQKRLTSDREIGCLLSGGLDSSLIASLVQKNMLGHHKSSDGKVSPSSRKRVKTFSIGMSGSPDLKYARKVAKWIGSDHHEVLLSADEFLSAIKDVIYRIESYDTTTVRASVGNYLVSKYISEKTDCKVIFNGDGSDEVCVGYVYNKDAPSEDALQEESERLVGDIHFFDVLRSDRSISSNGLEPRTPFLDKDFVEYYMSIKPSLKSFNKESRVEKFILRKAFDSSNLLPSDVLWRDKCAFSDGVSSAKNSWHRLLKSYIDSKVPDSEYYSEFQKISENKPILKETYFYRKIFIELFGEENCNLVPYYWMPKWTDCIDPSARELSGYKE